MNGTHEVGSTPAETRRGAPASGDAPAPRSENETGTRNPLEGPHPLTPLVREHPALALTSAYAAASFIGVMFSFAFYRELGVNFFNFADVSDLLMAVLREPVTFLLFLGGVVVAWILRAYYRWEWNFFQRHPPRSWLARAYYRISQPNYHSAWNDVVAVLAYTFLFITLYGDYKADMVREERGGGVPVTLETDSTRRDTLLLGATARYLLVWDAGPEAVSAIPAESVRRILMRPGTGQSRSGGQTPDDDATAGAPPSSAPPSPPSSPPSSAPPSPPSSAAPVRRSPGAEAPGSS